jgi:Domain of unknown function (DUF4350)
VSPRTLTRGARGWALAGGLLLGALVAIVAVGQAFSREPTGPASSSYATDAEGVAAWATLLARDGHPVIQLRKSLTNARLDPRATVVVLDPEGLVRLEGLRLLSFVRAGGRLLLGGSEPGDFLLALTERPQGWAPGRAEYFVPAPGAGAATRSSGVLASVRVIRTAGEGEWTTSTGYRKLLTSSSGNALLMERTIGSGTLLLIADASALQNRLLASADNARLALNLGSAPRAPVVFVESVHGYGEGRGLAALPASWKATLAGLLLAGLLWAAARARRLGPPEPLPDQDVPQSVPARGAYVRALSLLLRRAGTPQQLAAARTQMSDRARATRRRDGR